MDEENTKTIDGEHVILISIPDNVVKLQIVATILEDDGHIFECVNKLNLEQIIDARISGWEWENENVKYVVNDNIKELECG